MAIVHREVRAAASTRAPAVLELKLEPVPSAAPAARHALDTFADYMPADVFADLKVVVTELVTNAVKYGPGRHIELAVSLDQGGVVRGHVDDGGEVGDAAIHTRTPGPLGGGLGLLIVGALAEWGVRSRSSYVWFELSNR